jgi:hypothetical protein
MTFDVTLADDTAAYALAAAGLESLPFVVKSTDVLIEKLALPVSVECPYIFADRPLSARVTILRDGGRVAPTELRIELADDSIWRKVREKMLRYSVENKGDRVMALEVKELDASIERTLRAAGVTGREVEDRIEDLPRCAQERLMRLYDEVEYFQRSRVMWPFWTRIPEADRVFVSRWLIRCYESARDSDLRDHISMVFMNSKGLDVPEIADEVIRLIHDRRMGEDRWGLCEILSRTKDRRAAEVIASVLGEGDILTRVAVECLVKLRARQYVGAIQKFARHRDPDVRRAVTKALRTFGVAVAMPPPPVHLVKNRKFLPKGLEEWSANLDFENLEPALQKLATCVERGFGAEEIAEVIGVAEIMRPDQTKAFRFPITTKGKPGELWLVVFMDDIDSPDLEIHSSAEVIQNFESSAPLKE